MPNREALEREGRGMFAARVEEGSPDLVRPVLASRNSLCRSGSLGCLLISLCKTLPNAKSTEPGIKRFKPSARFSHFPKLSINLPEVHFGLGLS